MDTISAIRTFVSVADAGSFTGGAKALRLTPQLASKYVRQLEERLGTQLLARTTRQVSLTETGQAYLGQARNLIDQFDALEGLVKDEQAALSGQIRMTAPTGYGLVMVTPAIAAFQDDHPGIEIELMLTDRRVSLIEEGLDLAVRVGAAQDSSLTMRKLVEMPYVACASPDYLARFGEPKHPRALKTHNCLVNTGLVEPGVWRFQEDGKPLPVKVSGSLRFNQPRAIAELVRMGRGVSLLPWYTIRDDLEAGQVVPILEAYAPTPSAAYALYPSRRFLPPRVKALIDHLADWAKR